MARRDAGADGLKLPLTNAIGHDACNGPLTRWVEPTIPATLAAPFHPNANGMAATARVVVAVQAG